MRTALMKFRGDENGAVTVDWVVLCAGVVVVATTLVLAMQTNAIGLGDKVTAFMGTLR
ncbi:MAG: hypothetical protein AAF218_00610 [Pseudomonadota bacterium]